MADVNPEVEDALGVDVGRLKRHGPDALASRSGEEVLRAGSTAIPVGANVEARQATRLHKLIEVRVLRHAGCTLGALVCARATSLEWGCSDETGEECKRQGEAGKMHSGLMQNAVRG